METPHLSGHYGAEPGDGCRRADTAGRFAEANPAMCRLLGTSREAIASRHLEEFVAYEYMQSVKDGIQSLSAKGEWRGAARLQRPDGSRTDSDWRIKMLPESNACMGLATDVTQQRRYEAERERLLAQEKRQQRRKDGLDSRQHRPANGATDAF